jgi:aspartate-semialdehyde dehydrogenase
MRGLPERPRVAVLGATGAVGRVMVRLLGERRFPASSVRAIATARSRGQTLDFGTESLVVDTLEDRGFEDLDLVIVDTPDEASAELAPKAVEAGAIVVDNSSTFRYTEDVPLVVPEVNAADVENHRGLIASPNCTTITFVVPLGALHRTFGLERALISSYQSVSGAGRGGVEELREFSAKLVDQMDALEVGEIEGLVPEPELFPAPVAFNVFPSIGSIKEEGFTNEEWKMVSETRKIMGLPDLAISGTCVRVPAVVGHGTSVHARFAREVSVEEATAALRWAPGIEVVDLPSSILAAGKDPCFVGRIRRDPHDPRALWFFSSCDNLRKGAALNAVQIAELLLP